MNVSHNMKFGSQLFFFSVFVLNRRCLAEIRILNLDIGFRSRRAAFIKWWLLEVIFTWTRMIEVTWQNVFSSIFRIRLKVSTWEKKKLLASLVLLLRFVVLLAMMTVFSMFNVWPVYLWVWLNRSDCFSCSVGIFPVSDVESSSRFAETIFAKARTFQFVYHTTLFFS